MSMFRKTIGIVGMGNIGKVVAQKWTGAFECRILGYDPVAPKDVWPGIEQEKEADVVTLHVPLLASTRGLIGKK
jgi:D-3-phosphoglycerate dehydrogenase / 2-oxoglutarate reductase